MFPLLAALQAILSSKDSLVFNQTKVNLHARSTSAIPQASL